MSTDTPSDPPREGHLSGLGVSGQATLTAAEQRIVALAAAAHNHCEECTARHSGRARLAGVSEEDLAAIAAGHSPDEGRLRSLVCATHLIMGKRGHLDADDVAALEARGVHEAQLREIVTLIGLETIANYLSLISIAESG